MKLHSLILIGSLATLLSACGQSQGDRALSGAGIGAGVGAVGSAVTGQPAHGCRSGWRIRCRNGCRNKRARR